LRLGIDFGTTRTVVATAEQGRHAVVGFETPTGFADYLPGGAVCTPDILHFGFEATERMIGAPAVVRSIKRSMELVPPDEPVPELAGIGPSALSVVTRYLTFVRRMLFEHSNLDLDPHEPLEAMIAVPANASTRQRYLTLEGFQRAGFHVLGMINEPTAAAIEFARRNFGDLARRSLKRYLVVYDLGGGTFDSAAVLLEGRRFELVASEGVPRLGGDDFDEIILDLALEAMGFDAANMAVFPRVRALELCREAKETMTSSTRRLLVDLTPVLADTEPRIIDAIDIYDRCQPLLDRTLGLLDRVFNRLRESGLDLDGSGELGAVYLVGGSSSFPPVAPTLRRLHGNLVQRAPEPHAATAIGLAVAADPQAQIFVSERTTRYFGVWREVAAGREPAFDCILSKNQPRDGEAPLVVNRWYRPTHTIGQLRFIECTELSADGQPAGDVVPWCEVFFPYDVNLQHESELAGVGTVRTGRSGDEIVETYTFSIDGTVSLEIENLSHGYRRSFWLGKFG
jgi:molecular chaperone DnaK